MQIQQSVGEIDQFRRDVARELVVVEIQVPQSVGDGTRAQFCRDVACEFVVVEVQPLQIGEVA